MTYSSNCEAEWDSVPSRGVFVVVEDIYYLFVIR